MEAEPPTAAAASPPLSSIEVQNINHHHHKTAAGNADSSTIGTTTAASSAAPSTATATATANVASVSPAANAAAANAGGGLPPTVPYRSAGGLATESPAAVLSALQQSQNQNQNQHPMTSGGASSVSTISPGSLAGGGDAPAQNPAGGGNAVQFTARDTSLLSTPDLGRGGPTILPQAQQAHATPLPNRHLSVATSNPNADTNTNPSTSPTARASPRSERLETSRSTLHASLSSYYQSQNAHLEGAFGALLASIQDHTDELDVHQDCLDR